MGLSANSIHNRTKGIISVVLNYSSALAMMFEAFMPVVVAFHKDTIHSDTITNMVSISLGVVIAAYGEARFVLGS
ncbi:hypothetical protein ACLOJK_008793 [Asimina triloba]